MRKGSGPLKIYESQKCFKDSIWNYTVSPKVCSAETHTRILRLSGSGEGYEVESNWENHINVLKALRAIAEKTVVYVGLIQFPNWDAERLYYGPILDQWDGRVWQALR